MPASQGRTGMPVEMVEACSVAAGVKVEGMKVVATVMPVVRKVGLATLEELAR